MNNIDNENIKYFSVECIIDPDCRTDQICHNNKCIDPCFLENPCAINAICQGSNHAATCTCPAGLVGNPYVSCETGMYLCVYQNTFFKKSISEHFSKGECFYDIARESS